MVHAALAVATIGKGRIVSLDTRAAAAVSDVRLVLTHRDLGDVKSAGFLMAGGYGFQSLQPMLSPAIAYRGQPIALVAADSLEAAIEAAALVEATYAAEPISVTLDATGAETINQADTPLKNFIPEVIAGDADLSCQSRRHGMATARATHRVVGRAAHRGGRGGRPALRAARRTLRLHFSGQMLVWSRQLEEPRSCPRPS
jgi:CO/xanthine dehydrogenase Mo-binding subunit